jgi:hypothetical protein
MKIQIMARAMGLIAALSFAGAGAARADFNVKLPDVNKGELAVEHVGDFGSDKNPDKSNEQSYTAELEYGVTSWWQTELELEFNRDPGSGSGQRTRFDQITSENTFQFSERGEYWLDTGFFAEYGHGLLAGSTNETTFGPILRKDFLGMSNTLNLFVEKELGTHASGRAEFLYAWESRIDAWTLTIGRHFAVEPGFQYYGEPGQLGHFAHWADQDNRAGPQLFGKIFDIGPGTLEWNAGILVGLTSAVPTITPRWQFEYEIHF